jgi:parallel beta-helix repeat protein
MTAARWSVVVGTLAVAGALVALAGPLDPPAGLVAPSYKTLAEVEPRVAVNAANTPGDATGLFKIVQPGSYYLTGNITGVVGKHGIVIVASGVTLDLNGFDLVGVANSLDGVNTAVSNLTNIAVVHGSVRNWGDEGVDLGTLSALNGRVEGVLASGNTGNGIYTGFGCTISNCSAYFNAGGISIGSGCTVSNCSAFQNTGNGINASTASTFSNCSAYNNTGIGINVNNGSTIADCTARANALDGIRVTNFCMARGNICEINGLGAFDGAGIHATGSDNRIEGNNCIGADRGIDVDFDGNIIIKNSCGANTINWVIVANNVCGPILDRTAPASAAISGNSAPDSTGSTHPNANFTL